MRLLTKSNHPKSHGHSPNHYNCKKILKTFDLDQFGIYKTSRDTAIKQLVKYIANHEIEQFLDIGCGTGNTIVEILKHFNPKKVSGLDLSQSMLNIARSKILNFNAICDSALNINNYIAPNSCDLITMHFLLAYVDNKVIFDKLSTMLDTNGILSICTCTSNSYKFSKDGLYKLTKKVPFKFNIRKSIQEYEKNMPDDAKDLEQKLKNHGFEILAADTLVFSLKAKNCRELWGFMYENGWFVGALKEYKLSKAKVYTIYHLAKLFRLFRGALSDNLEVAVITAKKSSQHG